MNCRLDFEYPVTAVTGLNGAGKSTVGQLLLCAYKKLSTADYKRFYVKDFFPVSVADPEPFTSNATVEYQFQHSLPGASQSLTVARATKEWSGYKRQPEKAAIYIGLAFYLPKVERKDLTIYSAKNITLANRTDVEDGNTWASKILGNTYDDVFFQGVASANRQAELGMAKRLGSQYSENNMGFGEGRVIHTIRLLESCPTQSLVVLEEPETSLHEYAQYEFAKYLMDVSLRRGHQIVLSTHSSAIISALPPEGRKMLARTQDGVEVYDRLSSVHLRNALTEGHNGHLIICVEDEFAGSVLREIIKKWDKELLRRISIIPFGDARAVKGAVSALLKSGVSAIAVRDGDQTEVPLEKLFCLPGNEAPEKTIFLSVSGKQVLQNEYGFDLAHQLIAHPGTDHHQYSKLAAQVTGTAKEVLETDCIRAFIAAQAPDWGKELTEKIRNEA